MTDWQYTFNGLTFGDGTSIDVVTTDGLESLPTLRTSDLPRAGRHGEHAGQDLAAGRTIVFELELSAATDAAFRALVDEVRAATTPQETEVPLIFQHPGAVAQRVMARPRRRSAIQDVAFGLGFGRVAVELHATDPVIYADAEGTGSVGFPAGGTGRTYPRTYPRVYGSSGTTGLVVATNDGDFPVEWTATITGPWVNPTITHVGLGRTLTVNVTLASGEVLTVNSETKSILLGGTASRYSSLVQPAAWFDLAPGSNEIRFGGASGSGTAGLAWRSGWI